MGKRGHKKTRSQKRRDRRRRRMRNMPEYASMSETVEVVDSPTQSQLVGQIYNINDVQLASFKRASTVAEAYAQFRITKLTFKYQPLLDTFTSTGTTQVPYLYWVINKQGNEYPALNKQWFLANGSKGIRFDDKTLTISYAPACVFDVLEAGTPAPTEQPNAYKTRQWLNTNKDAFLVQGFAPSQVSHAGHIYAVLSEGSSQPMQYRLTMTAEFQFKKPNFPAIPDAPNVVHPIIGN